MKKLGEVILISEELLKLYSPISKNVGVDKIYPFIHLAQPYYIQPILGQPLMEQLQVEIDNDALTDENKALVLKIAMPLAMWTTYLAVRGLGYSITQKGVTKERSENSESLNEKEMAEYILSLKNQAEMAQELLISYLCNCKELYPLWHPTYECNCEKYCPTEGTAERDYKTLIYFPDMSYRNNCNCGCNTKSITEAEVQRMIDEAVEPKANKSEVYSREIIDARFRTFVYIDANGIIHFRNYE